MKNSSPFAAMLADTLPSGTDLKSAPVVGMLQAVPPGLWIGYTLAETTEGKAGALEMIRRWVMEFGLALV